MPSSVAEGSTRLRVLVLTKIFPNRLEPHSSPFNRQQFQALSALADVDVLATIPWFPGARLFARWSPAGRLVALPREDVIGALPVGHPRFFFIPKWGLPAAGVLYAASLFGEVWRRRHRIDVILGSWAYPDGCAAVILGKLLGLPSVVKLHGSDINILGEQPGPRRNLAWALPRASRVVAVSRALGEKVAALGVAKENIDIVRNGVDTALFYPRDPFEMRRALGMPAGAKIILYVGRLERQKGVLDLLAAFEQLGKKRNDAKLVLLGDGGARSECAAFGARMPGRVELLGSRPLEQVPLWMGASTLVTLPSWNEGTPNCLLEALACGRPVVATRTGGIPDVVHSDLLGELVPIRDPAALAGALERVAGREHDASKIAAVGAPGGWPESAQALHQSLLRAVGRA